MGNRRKSRELALQALFALDLNKTVSKAMLDEFVEQHGEEISEPTREFFQELVDGVLNNREKIDPSSGSMGKKLENFPDAGC